MRRIYGVSDAYGVTDTMNIKFFDVIKYIPTIIILIFVMVYMSSIFNESLFCAVCFGQTGIINYHGDLSGSVNCTTWNLEHICPSLDYESIPIWNIIWLTVGIGAIFVIITEYYVNKEKARK